jgi:hypothetical protein
MPTIVQASPDVHPAPEAARQASWGLCMIVRPMQAAMDGREFRNFMERFLRFAAHSWGKVFNYAWSIGMTIGPVVALVLLWDDRGSASFVLTALISL